MNIKQTCCELRLIVIKLHYFLVTIPLEAVQQFNFLYFAKIKPICYEVIKILNLRFWQL